jgi:hypothetical protein
MEAFVRTGSSGRWLAMAAAWILIAATPAAAADYVEGEADAGETMATATAVDAEVTAIAGELTASPIGDRFDRDVYRICLSGGGTFSASTVPNDNGLDTQLFLLRADGTGVYANDDFGGAPTLKSLLPAGDALTPTQAGAYLLLISTYNDDPVDGDGAEMFPSANGPAVSGPASATGVFADWTNSPNFSSGGYRIHLTGTQSCRTDTTAPGITITTPADGVDYLLGEPVLADFACADEAGGSGLLSCQGDLAPGAAVDTSAVGSADFSVTATDVAGNEATAVSHYRVVYDFSGPVAPLNAYPAVNDRTAGATAPYKFSLEGDKGSAVVAWVRSADVTCGSPGEPQTGEPATTSPLTYDADSDLYQLNFKTEKSWAGTCRQLLVALDDGTVHRANFRFR